VTLAFHTVTHVACCEVSLADACRMGAFLDAQLSHYFRSLEMAGAEAPGDAAPPAPLARLYCE